MSRRSRAREVVLQVLYQDDLNPPANPAAAEAFLRLRLGEGALVAFAGSLLEGVRSRRDELDRLLAEKAENWTLGRMAVTDRNVLRLGAYEILFTQTPQRVAINEAVELAKRFGARQSAHFVNGVLDRFMEKPLGNRAALSQTEGNALRGAPPKERREKPEPTESVKRVPTAEDFARALKAVSDNQTERKFPPYYRTLLKTHCELGALAAADLADAMGWDSAATVLVRYGELGKRLSEELHFDPPLYDASGGPLWISVLAVCSEGREPTSEESHWELRGEIAAALEVLGWK